MDAATRRGVVALVAAGATVLVVLLALWAASAGPGDPFAGEGRDPDRITATTPTASESFDVGRPADEPDERSASGAWVGVVIAVLVVLVAAALGFGVVLLVVAALRRRPGRRRRGRDVPDVDGDVDPVAAVTALLVADAAAQERVLVEGEPRNAIVEVWHRLEVRAGEAGVAREPSDTSSELAERLLRLVDADAAAVSRLAALYRMARFSDHRVTEADRVAALEALRHVHGSLRPVAGGAR